MTAPTPLSVRRAVSAACRAAAFSAGALGVLTVALVAAPAGAQVDPADPAPPATAAAPDSTPSATTPPAPTTTSGAPVPTTAPRPGATGTGAARRPIPKDPAALQAAGRNPAGVIVSVSAELDAVPVTSVEYDGAAKLRDRDAAALADANHRAVATAERLAELERDRVALAALVERGVQRQRKLTVADDELAALRRSFAVQRFVSGSSDEPFLDTTRTVDEQLTRSQETRLAGEAERQIDDRARFVTARLERVGRELDDLQRRQHDNVDDVRRVTALDVTARADVERLTAAVAGAEAELRRSRPMTVVTGSDLPLVALDAYWRAAADMAATRPTCAVSWPVLAAIGRSESNHGRSAGGQPGADGRTTVPVIGIPLDGSGATRAIADTDRGTLDTDPQWDRAVGVMQFIPGTWRRYAEDQSGDKLADPQNIYDAALASAKLLCTHGPGLDTDAGLRRAVFAYNHSAAYVDLVMSRAVDYGALPVPPMSPPAAP